MKGVLRFLSYGLYMVGLLLGRVVVTLNDAQNWCMSASFDMGEKYNLEMWENINVGDTENTSTRS